jgi:hypothetical protein
MAGTLYAVEKPSTSHEGQCCLFTTFKRQCFKTLKMVAQYCHLLISLENEMQESSWNISLDIMSHCSPAGGLTLSECLHT